MTEGLSKNQLIEVQQYFDKGIDGLKIWIKENMVCAPHCMARQAEEDIRHIQLETKVDNHINEHQKTNSFIGQILPYAWGAICAACAVAWETLKK